MLTSSSPGLGPGPGLRLGPNPRLTPSFFRSLVLSFSRRVKGIEGPRVGVGPRLRVRLGLRPGLRS